MSYTCMHTGREGGREGGANYLQVVTRAHKGRKLRRWMTPPTAIAAIASFHVQAVWHIVHSPCICTQQPCICVQHPTSQPMKEALPSLHRPHEPTLSPSSVPGSPPGSDPNPATRRRRFMNTHAAAKRTPPRCMHHLPLVTAHTVRSQKFTPALIRPPYQLRSILT